MAAPSVLPTLPSFRAVNPISAARAELVAALAFVEGAVSWTAADLVDWFRTHAAELGRDTPPISVADPSSGPDSLRLAGPSSRRSARPEQVSRLLAMARWQVVMTLRGMLEKPCDDRFLQAAIYAGRVVRRDGRWRYETDDAHALSDVVLGLFAVDVLTHRELYDQDLCVCELCGRVSFNPAATTRIGCPDHVPGTDASSGVLPRTR
jgi:hypothetical protein